MRSIVAFIALFGTLATFGQEKCFENNGLKDSHLIEIVVKGNSVTGSFGVAPDFDASRMLRYDFSGTVAGSVISVKFPREKPESLPQSRGTQKWTLLRTSGGEKLRVTLYGKNYNTNKWSNYTADYSSCASLHSAASSSAKRVSFAKGSSSALLDLSFKSKDEKQSFLLGLRKGQRITVTAPGCGISFFYPDKRPYEEGTAIDTWGSDALPQEGDYLFVISPAGEPGTCTLRFEAR